MLRFIFFFLTIIAASSCVEHNLDPPEVNCEQSGLALSLIETIDATSCVSLDGFIRVEASGGKPPYKFSLNDDTSDDGIFSGLRSGGYSVSVSDDQGCEYIIPNILISAEGFKFSTVITPDTECVGGNGSIALTINEGTPPFEFQFMDQGFGESSVFEFLEAGTYDVDVRDAEGCSASLEVSIPVGQTSTSWENTIRPLMVTYCAKSGCHNGISRPDLRLYEQAKFYSLQIRELTANGSMPFEGSLTQEQIDLIGCWVNEGAPEN
jgi:hypothetical protein